ncbi:hypothetical protein NC652_013605 [Populus alba x Populus x berolinensis]|nr:hypothetical protein NC652_013605 [Populus alba x Populus x berolinensis]
MNHRFSASFKNYAGLTRNWPEKRSFEYYATLAHHCSQHFTCTNLWLSLMGISSLESALWDSTYASFIQINLKLQLLFNS